MKKIFVTVLLTALMAGTALAREYKSLDKATEAYLTGLNHPNPGVEESAIINVMLLKLYHPEKNFDAIIKRLDKMTVNSPERIIRLKAFIASNFLKHPDRFEWIKKGDFEDTITFFENYAARLEKMNHNLERKYELTASNE